MMQPIVKWAGGKRQLLTELRNRMPERYTTYVEPFFGGGALFFDANPQKAIINDTNSELINLYRSVRDCPDEFIQKVLILQESYNGFQSIEEKREYYYLKRKMFNNNIVSTSLSVDDAALFLFLNKACYNGLYRVNAKGRFNTPTGKRKYLNLCSEENIYECSAALKKCNIMCTDFEIACKGLRKGAFVYFDSPYYDTFDTYQSGGFSEDDHIRLAELFKALTEHGVKCMLSNSDTIFIKDLYKDFKIDVVNVNRMINCNGFERSGTELIIRNY